MTQDEMTALERGAERIAGMNLGAQLLESNTQADQGDKLLSALANAHSRRTPVKGVCVNCGKHYSRHIRVDEFAYCNQDRQSHFTLEREPVKPAEAAPGAITREQAQRLADLIASKESRRVEWDASWDAAQMREQKFTAACVELDDFIASITAK